MKGPLEGISVLELTRVGPGEHCTQILADMGADVLKIELPPSAGAAERPPSDPPNRNKRSIVLDLKTSAGQATLRQLSARADVLLEGFRPGVAARLGAGWPELQAINPRLVYCAMSGYGQTGPYRDRSGHDLNYIAQAGVLDLIGSPGSPPVIPLNLVADLGGASLHAALGIVLALFARERTGRGQFVDISYLDCAVSLLAATPILRRLVVDGKAPRRGEGWLGGGFPYYAIYACADERLLTLACTEASQWRRFCEAVGRPDLAGYCRASDHVHRAPNASEAAARKQVAQLLRGRKLHEWLALLESADVCAAPVLEPAEIFEDPHLRMRGMIRSGCGPQELAEQRFGIAIGLSMTPGSIRLPAPQTGQHTEEVLRELGCRDQG